MTTGFKNMYLTAMKITANFNEKVIHYLSKNRCGSNNRKREIGAMKRFQETTGRNNRCFQETTGREELELSRDLNYNSFQGF